MNCALCNQTAKLYFSDPKGQRYFKCDICDFRFLDPALRLSAHNEHERYKLHKNNVFDADYQKFVSPLFRLIQDQIPATARGLDYGCGAEPVLSYLLKNQGYDIALYDPFFQTEKSALDRTYDFIFSIEAIEHFFYPNSELGRLKQMVTPQGRLIFMTLMYHEGIDFASWYYRRDPTHVGFYSQKTFSWIATEFGFKSYRQFGERISWFEV